MSDVFDEISEELRKENYAALFKKYGKGITIFCFAILLAVAVYVGERSYRHAKVESASGAYFNALNLLRNPGDDQGIKILSELSQQTPRPVKSLATLRAAAYFLEHNEQDKALALYDKLSSDSGADQAFRNLATIELAKNIIGNPEKEKKYAIKNRLLAITTPESPFKSFAYEELGLLGIAEHDSVEARKYFLLLVTDPTAAEWTKKNVEELLKLPEYE